MSEYRRMRRNIRLNVQKHERRLSRSIYDEVNHDLVSVSVGESHEDLGQHKDIFLSAPKKPAADLTTTSNYELFQWIPRTTNIIITN